MNIFINDNKEFENHINNIEHIVEEVTGHAKDEDIRGLNQLITNFKYKTDDFYNKERKLNIGVVGQVKAGKSSFLNTLLFGGKEVLPKASTPKTATLTKMEYAEENIIEIEYYSVEEWEVLEENATVDLEDEIYVSAREIVGMVKRNGIDPLQYLERKKDEIRFDTYEDLLTSLNNYVGEDGKFTAIVKAVTLFLNNEEFKGLSIVDTPGLNDPIASRTIRTKEFMEVCDVVFFLSQSGSFLDKSDWTLLSSQLPQKGVKKLVLIASKYDSGIRDILRESDEDDIFGEDENTADNIPKACKLIRKKLRKRAKSKVEEFVKDLQARGSSIELMEVIKQCSNPIMVSSLVYNMTNKQVDEYSKEESNIYNALVQFSEDIESDLKLLGNFEEVNQLFGEVAREKEAILEKKAKTFVPNAREELRGVLETFKDKTTKRIQILEGSDSGRLAEQKAMMESQVGNIRADIATVFGELKAKLESEKAESIRELRVASKEYLTVEERTKTEERTRSYTTGFWFWKKTHYRTYTESYSYCLATDAIENLSKYALDASNQVEEVFVDSLQLKEIKRKLLNIVVNNFDMGSEKYDSSLFRIMVEDIVSAIEFPVFNLDISDTISTIAGKFSGEITSSSQKTELTTALTTALSRVYEEICGQLGVKVREFKGELEGLSKQVEKNLLDSILGELEMLLEQCKQKESEIKAYKEYVAILEKEIKEI